MAEIKFNFYSIYKDYYRNINDIKKFNLLLIPYYTLNITSYFMETLSRIYKITLPLYLLHKLRLTQRMDRNICKSLKKINRQKIIVKTIFKLKKINYKTYFLLKF